MTAHLVAQVGVLERLLRAIAAGDPAAVRLLKAHPDLARAAASTGATRAGAERFYLPEIGHYVYTGDTALHVAAAGYHAALVRALVELGADPAARNRRGAQPPHYCAAGSPGSPRWNPDAQSATLRELLLSGADPGAPDRSGVTPLHVAVRTRCAPAVRILLAHGADPSRPNGSGSTPLHLAVQDTGRGGSGSAPAREQQAEIVRLLLEHGADPRARDGRGKTVLERDSRGLLQRRE